MARKEPSDAAMIAARLAKAYPSLSAYSAASLAHELCSIEKAQRRHAERCCSGEDGGYVKRGRPITGYGAMGANARTCAVHDPVAEERAGKRVEQQRERWTGKLIDLLRGDRSGQGFVNVTLQDDPRGRVLLLQLPGEADAS